jgi:hypothetical protein
MLFRRQYHVLEASAAASVFRIVCLGLYAYDCATTMYLSERINGLCLRWQRDPGTVGGNTDGHWRHGHDECIPNGIIRLQRLFFLCRRAILQM